MDKINNIGLSRELTSCYDFQGFTEQEVWSRIAQKINIIIEHFNYLDTKIENEKDNNKAKFDYLLGEGLNESLSRIIIQKISDGTIGELINGTLLKGINEQLFNIVSKLNYYIEDFGGKANDTTVDNSIALLKAINTIKNTGGNIVFRNGDYTFKTNIILNEKFSNINIIGYGIYDGNSGTLFNWIGNEYFLELVNGGQYYSIQSFKLQCNKNYGFKLASGNFTNFKSSIKNIFISNALRGINLKEFAYYFIDNISFLCSGEVNTQYFIKIGEGGTNRRELLYIDKISIDGNDESDCPGIIIESGQNIYLNGLDIANLKTNRAIYLHTTTNNPIDMVMIDNLNMTRCDSGIVLSPECQNITQISIRSLTSLMRGTSKKELSIRALRPSTFTTHLSIFDMKVRKLGTVQPDEIIVCEPNSLRSDSYIEVSSNLTKGKIKTGDNTSKVKLHLTDLGNSFGFRPNGDGSTKVFELKLFSNSTFVNLPVILVNTNLNIPFKLAHTNTYGGDCKITLTFDTAPPSGLFSVFAIMGDSGFFS